MATSKEELKRLHEKYGSRIVKFGINELEVQFSNSNDWIEFVAIYFANHYRQHLEYWQATAMDDRAEYNWWQSKLETEVGQVYDAFITSLNYNYDWHRHKKETSLLGKLGIRKYDILLDTKKNTGIYLYVLNAIGSSAGPSNVFLNNVKYTMSFDEEESRYQFVMEYLKKN